MQSAFGLFILALNSARLGYETMIYFTFEGLNMIRPGFLENMRCYPTGVEPPDEISAPLYRETARQDGKERHPALRGHDGNGTVGGRGLSRLQDER